VSRGGRRHGAGRPGHRMQAEVMQRLDIRLLVRKGVLVSGDAGRWRWLRNGTEVASIGYTVEQDRLHLNYQSNGRPVWQPIPRRWTGCHFGGRRQWFGCPTCERSVAVLYFRQGRFACRTCQNVAYQSQSEDFLTSIHRRRERFEARLDGDWSRPKGMHLTTYKLLMSQIRECEMVLDGLLVMFMERRGWLS